MTKARIAIFGLALLAALAPFARAARVEDLPPVPPDAAARFLLRNLADGPSVFVFRPSEGAPPSIAPDPILRFEPPFPEGGGRAGWLLRTIPMAATDVLTDFRLRGAELADAVPFEAPPPRAESVPEPATILLFLVGVLLVLLARRRP